MIINIQLYICISTKFTSWSDLIQEEITSALSTFKQPSLYIIMIPKRYFCLLSKNCHLFASGKFKYNKELAQTLKIQVTIFLLRCLSLMRNWEFLQNKNVGL